MFPLIYCPDPPPPQLFPVWFIWFFTFVEEKKLINVALKPNRDGLLISLFGEILLTQTSLNSKTKAGEPAEASFHFLKYKYKYIYI